MKGPNLSVCHVSLILSIFDTQGTIAKISFVTDAHVLVELSSLLHDHSSKITFVSLPSLSYDIFCSASHA